MLIQVKAATILCNTFQIVLESEENTQTFFGSSLHLLNL